MTPAATNQRRECATAVDAWTRRHEWRSGRYATCTPTRRPKTEQPLQAHPNRERKVRRPMTPLSLEGPLVITGDDGIERYRIDEWRRRLGTPDPIVFHYDAFAE